MPRGTDPLKKVELPSGEIRYRFTVDVGQKVKTDKQGRPAQTQKEMTIWTADQAAAFLAATANDWVAIAWEMSMYGLRWCDVDMINRTITIQKTRSILDGVVIEDEPKSERSKRTLPLDDDMVTKLTALQLSQRGEAEEAGDAYGARARTAGSCTWSSTRSAPRCTRRRIRTCSSGG
ncbi:hypothetical protein ACTOB_000925 [Actinoplanes oblitus]|uniref:Tyr recombinase domain-containing protein n=1 Tax=Actinoplanes oblitus TaxID=3040509 RepID=A0ABY8WM47_9ACTN|nr:hypothetical protein [Actinoplanes oblitus]WIM97409.1 hypothetical protein ACTOB_000925 [Actinoplanes oblitus]